MNKFVASIAPIQKNDVLVSSIKGNNDAKMDVVYDALEIDGEIFVVGSDINEAEFHANQLNDAIQMEVTLLAENVKDKHQSIAGLRDKGVADDVLLAIEEAAKELKQMDTGVIEMETATMKQDPEVVAMMKAAGIEIGQSLALSLGTVVIKGFNATGEGVMVSVEVGGQVKEIHAKDLVEFKKEATTMEGSVKVAFEGTSQVPVSVSAEEEALANIANEAKNTINKETKGAEVKMENVKTNAEQVVGLSAAQKFYQEQAAKLQNAVKAPEKKEAAPANENKKEEKEMNVETNVGVIGAIEMGAGFKKEENTKEEKEMNKENTEVKGRGNVGVTGGNAPAATGRGTVGIDFSQAKKNQNPNMKMAYDESLRGGAAGEKSTMPWYLDAQRAGFNIEDLAEILMHRNYAPLGITAIRNLNPERELAYANDKIVALVEVQTGAVNLRFRIQENKNEKSNSDLSSTNIAWEERWNADTFRKELQPVYSFYRKNEMTVTIKCCGTYINDVKSGEKAKCSKCGKEHTVALTATHSDNGAVKGSQATVSSYVRQTLGNFNIEVNRGVLGIVLAFAQLSLGLDMHNTLTIEQEDAILDAYKA